MGIVGSVPNMSQGGVTRCGIHRASQGTFPRCDGHRHKRTKQGQASKQQDVGRLGTNLAFS
jgi:hypothetical protein